MLYKSIHNDQEAIALVLGDQAHDFFNSDVGLYVLQRTQEKIDAAKTKLIQCDPFKYQDVMAYQNEIKIAEHGVKLLNELIIAGETAERNLKLESDEDETQF
jgi:hypothetical protein